MKIISVLVICLVNIFSTYAELPPIPKWSLDQLGASRYKDVAIRNQPVDMGAGIFTQDELFGAKTLPVIEGWLKKGVPLVKYNLRWSDTHSFSRADIPKVVKEAKRFVPLMNQYNAHCLVSGATEHKLSVADAQAFANAILAVIPEKCIYINNPWIGGGGKLLPTTPRIWNEVHGKENAPNGEYTYSFDGTAAEDADTQGIKNKHIRAKTFFFWSPRFNGHYDNVSLPRPQRKGFPDDKMIRSIVALKENKGSTVFPKGAIYKSHSENKGTGDVRAEKPVVIVKNRVGAVMVGNVKCNYYGAYQNGYYRYYCPKYGYEISKDVVDVKAGNRIIGKVNPAFRDGVYR